MAYFKLITFGGIAPELSPRLLAEELAQTAKDVVLDSGRLVPITDNSTTQALNPTGGAQRTSVYKYETGTWLEWDEDVDVVPGPIAGDTTHRLYWTGEDYPRMGNSTVIEASGSGRFPRNSYRLGIPAPTGVPTAKVTAGEALGTPLAFDGSSGSVVTILNDETITLLGVQWNTLTAGDPVKYAHGGGTAIGGLTTDTVYYLIKHTTPKIKLATSVANATAETPVPINLTALGVGTTHTITPLDDGTGIKYSTSYVYTFVSAFGEEGPPSDPSIILDKVDGQTVTVEGMDTAVSSGDGRTNVNITHKNLYRSNTGSNTTNFQFVETKAISAASHTDAKKNAALAELIPSTYWIGPPTENSSDYPDGPMKGLTALPNGVFAGFTGKRLCFSEPYLPHAWPVSYRITLEETIVAIGAAGNGLIVGTTGTPYLVAGTDPAAMSALRIEAAQACLSKRSLVDMGPFVLYAGADGLIAAAGTDVRVITEGLISPQQWRANYYPTVLKGFLWEGRYVGLYTSGGNYVGFIFDPRGGTNQFVELTQTSSTDAAGGFTDPDDNELYLIIDTNLKKFQGGSSNQTFTWKSKEFVPSRPASMGFLKVDAEAYPVTVKVYGDGTLFYHASINVSGNDLAYRVTTTTPTISSPYDVVDIPEPIVRLPGGKYSTFAIELSSATTINEVCIAESIDEIREL